MALGPDALLSSGSVLMRSIEAMVYLHPGRESYAGDPLVAYVPAGLGQIVSLQ